jgi:aldehyde:ferredoxin oxidoreductase
LFEEPLISGASDGVSLDTVEFETALDEYYKQAGWDTQNGTPAQETLDNLGLPWLADF